ncbi:MAG: DUF255 domain-containing protein, partial [Flavobacteriales bacterium]|nr:DUF255 domain-containing protein [Flavobacteriales bacterium]
MGPLQIPKRYTYTIEKCELKQVGYLYIMPFSLRELDQGTLKFNFKSRPILLFLLISLFYFQVNAEICYPYVETTTDTNSLGSSQNPYLRSYSNSSINWHEWSEGILDSAKRTEKPLMISIGFASCHWCHVMESKTFSDSGVSSYMNENFICIRIDKDERPDIDMLYQKYASVIDQNTGWPMNVIAMSDGSPVYTDTYQDPETWLSILKETQSLILQNPLDAMEYSTQTKRMLHKLFEIQSGESQDSINIESLSNLGHNLYDQLLDTNYSILGTQKFILPSLQTFLLYCDPPMPENPALKTLDNILKGGIYDHVGGGVHRYSIDQNWHIPHFEKTLDDNAQFISLLCLAYLKNPSEHYKLAAHETLLFVERELLSQEGFFFNALDSGTEEEGSLYTWTYGDILETCGKDSELFVQYFDVRPEGNFENGKNIFYSKTSKRDIPLNELMTLEEVENKFLAKRQTRPFPAIDVKCIISGNALMASAYISMWRTFGDDIYLKKAEDLLERILHLDYSDEPKLPRMLIKGKAYSAGYLDDYSFLISALIEMYQSDFNQLWLSNANMYCRYVLDHFRMLDAYTFSYSEFNTPVIFALPDNFDQENPSSNASMAFNLCTLGNYFEIEEYINNSKKMMDQMHFDIVNNPKNFAMWAKTLFWMAHSKTEIIFCGAKKTELAQEFFFYAIPYVLPYGDEYPKSAIPPEYMIYTEEGKNQDFIYVCRDKTCQKPLQTLAEALELIKKLRK